MLATILAWWGKYSSRQGWRMKEVGLCCRYHNADADNKARKQEGIQSAGTISQAH